MIRMNDSARTEDQVDELPRFSPGDLVSHKRYRYRGVVVDFDMRCLADEQWYQSNQTQPDRNQPWYHVLVHGSEAVTYVAQENLQADPEAKPVAHPLVELFFEDFCNGRHIRNDKPWQF